MATAAAVAAAEAGLPQALRGPPGISASFRGWIRAPGDGRPPSASLDSTVVVIAPSALPGNAGVQIEVTHGARWIGPVQVVYASPQCTGS